MRDVFESRGGSPCVLCVISGLSKWAYRRPDGVLVVPIPSLGPRSEQVGGHQLLSVGAVLFRST